MKFKVFGVDFFVSFPSIAFISLAIVCDKKSTVPICIGASLLHELGHIAAMRLTKVKVQSVSINLGDIAINADALPLSYKAEFFVNISGVLVNFLISLTSFLIYILWGKEVFRSFFISNILIGAFNLLPVRYLDGGQIAFIILQRFISQKNSERILNILTFCFMLPLATLAFLFLIKSKNNYSLLIAVLYLICTLVSKEFKNVS